MRTVDEWIGRTDDAAVPPRVKLRILDRQRNDEGLPICPDCTMPIRPGDGVEFDHETALADGGEHREDNLRAKHLRCHRLKTAREAHARAEARAQAKSVYGLKERRGFATNRSGRFKQKINGEIVRR